MQPDAAPLDTLPDVLPVAAEVAPHVAFVRCLAPEPPDEDDWLDACYRLTPQVERVGAAAALLGLGACTHAEALAAMRDFLAHLGTLRIRARAGVGTSATLAQLALLTAPPSCGALASVAPGAEAAFLRDAPVEALAGLHPAGTATPEVVERLTRYGLHTLGHVARLGELALCRQFGAAVGAFLAAVAGGGDSAPLRPSPAPEWLRFRLRLDAPTPPERALAALPALASRAATELERRGRVARAVRLRVWWEDGGVESARLSLRQHIGDARLLAAELARALSGLLPDSGADGRVRSIAGLRVVLGDLAPALPEQAGLWQARAVRRRAALERVEEGLARRHGRAMLCLPRVASPAAIFAEECYQLDALAPTGTEGRATVTSARRAGAARDAWQGVPQRLHWW